MNIISTLLSYVSPLIHLLSVTGKTELTSDVRFHESLLFTLIRIMARNAGNLAIYKDHLPVGYSVETPFFHIECVHGVST